MDLYQSKVWVDGAGRVHKIKKMDADHRANVIAYLRRAARTIALRESLKLLAIPDPSDGVFWAVESTLADLANPQRWIEETPLMKALVQADAKWRREHIDLLEVELCVSEDSAKIDLEMTCSRCGKALCDVEGNDNLEVLVRVAKAHVCKGAK